MCSYCGCRANSVIARLSTEHDDIVNGLGEVRRASASGDPAALAAAAEALGCLLRPHTAREERALFAELRQDPEFAAHVDALCAEHRDIDGALLELRAGDHEAAERLDARVRRHIDKEENGVFPAAVIALDGAAWERVMSAEA